MSSVKCRYKQEFNESVISVHNYSLKETCRLLKAKFPIFSMNELHLYVVTIFTVLKSCKKQFNGNCVTSWDEQIVVFGCCG